jgi:tetratricopeptide (TPR) repeat protein
VRAVFVIFVAAWSAVAAAQTTGPASDRDLERALRERGLTELLERHLERSAGDDPVSLALKRRELLLAAYRDSTRTIEDRLDQLKRATAALQSLLDAQPEHPEAEHWRLQLGMDLMLRQAEPYVNNILFRGGTRQDAAELRTLASTAAAQFESVATLLDGIDERLDKMTETEFEAFERSGDLERLRGLVPRAAYFLRWANFYEILAKSVTGELSAADREALLGIATYLSDTTGFTTQSQSETGVQCQTLLLVGMCRRLAGETREAMEALNKCIEVAEATLPSERGAEVTWAAQVAQLERIRTARDAGNFDAAHAAAGSLIQALESSPGEDSMMLLAAATLDRDVYLAEVASLRAPGSPQASALREMAAETILRVADRSPEYESAIFGEVYATLDIGVDPAAWDTVEKLAFLIGVVERMAANQAGGRTNVSAPESLSVMALRASQAATLMLNSTEGAAGRAEPRTRYYLGLLEHLRGNELAAVDQFVTLVESHPTFGRSAQAMDYALKISASLYDDPTTRSAAGVRDAFIRATRVLVTAYPESEQAAHWRFFLAGALEESRQYENAALEYARVRREHERADEARYRRVWCLWKAYVADVNAPARDSANLPRRAFEIIEAARECAADLARERASAAADRQEELTQWIAAIRLIQAEMRLRPEVEQVEQALDLVKNFELEFAGFPDLVVRALRIRLIAYQRLNDLDSALRVVSDYVSRDPDNAGLFMQELLTSLRDDVELLRQHGLHQEAAGRIEAALRLARQLDDWAMERGDRLSPENHRAVRLQLADACLLAEQYEEALNLFEECLAEDDTKDDSTPVNATALFGRAESLFHLGRYEEANTIFNRLWRGLPQAAPMWWRAAARILACNIELGGEAKTLQRYIQQHRRIDPEFGGTANRAEFEALEKRNRERMN